MSKAVMLVGPWYGPSNKPTSKRSILRNHWVRVERGGRVVYAQWEDTGPMVYNDTDYVFGSARPTYKPAGIDLSAD
jgi:hypothetical protein